ncbi:MAG: hypothetical protein QXY74_07635 [Candidatus Bathyarchaeia archaeon]
MVRMIHFIPVGQAPCEVHVAGIPKFGADEVVLFVNPQSTLASAVEKHLRKEISYRTVYLSDGYLDPLKKANDEAGAYMVDGTCIGAYMVDGTCIAVNVSTNSGVMSLAIEDAIRTQLYYFHRRNFRGAYCSAFRYIVFSSKKPTFVVAPFWNIFDETHNDIFQILVDTENLARSKEPIGLNRLWESYSLLRPEEASYESFRKAFRGFKQWMKNNPCFVEQVYKSPRYKIIL